MIVYAFYESDTRVMMYANALAKRGDEVDIIALRQSGQSAQGTVNGVRVLRVQERAYKEKGKFDYLWHLLKFLFRSSVTVSKEHLKRRYDIVHVHSVPDFEVFAAIVPRLLGAKIILDIHDIVPEFYAAKFNAHKNSGLYRMLLRAEKLSCAFADHVIVSNDFWKRTLCRSVKGDKCTTIMNYPDGHIFYARPRMREDKKFIMMYPGTLNRHQGLDIAVRSFQRIAQEAPHAEFHIYGTGGMKEDLENLISHLGLADRVLLKGWLESEKIAEVMANADLGVVPKRNDSFGGEAFSTKTLEFMSLGVPILVSATKIDRYYFNDSVVKFFEPENEVDLAEKMLTLINDEEERKRLVANATKFLEEYTWENKKHLYLDLVDRLAGREKQFTR